MSINRCPLTLSWGSITVAFAVDGVGSLVGVVGFASFVGITVGCARSVDTFGRNSAASVFA